MTSQLDWRTLDAPEGTRRHGTVASLGGVAFGLVSLLTLLAVYVIVLIGGDFALTVARVGGVASLAALVILTLGVGMSYWIDGSRKGALGWGLVTAILTCTLVIATAAVLGLIGDN